MYLMFPRGTAVHAAPSPCSRQLVGPAAFFPWEAAHPWSGEPRGQL